MAENIDKNLARKNVIDFINKVRSKKIKIITAYIFGSLVKGNFNEWSDIDVAIISGSLSGDIFDDRVLLMKLRRDIDLRIEPHPFLPEEWDESNPFVLEIKKNGEKII
ncbi:MAG: nucleotidyltransferase domain-containing protein [Candidatus Cloacimonetes bacterium]|nr:nucleotidyltransferase domain-containing protein [Candidatus Cloacimonadota bacterium]MBL7086653.1 nucleotidyltransferase domain-containing protein [Candidatus Cloacimonadota bacterium]